MNDYLIDLFTPIFKSIDLIVKRVSLKDIYNPNHVIFNLKASRRKVHKK